MTRIDMVRSQYERVTEKLFADSKAFADYLTFSGRFFKLPAEHTISIYADNPAATMVADYDTWKKFGRQVKRGTDSTPVISEGKLKHYFDVSQTAGDEIPYQWSLDKTLAEQLSSRLSQTENADLKSVTDCINHLAERETAWKMADITSVLNIPEADKAAFEKSVTSMVKAVMAARCAFPESKFKWNGTLDMSAHGMLKSAAELERLAVYVQSMAKNSLLKMEKTIRNIRDERSIDYGSRFDERKADLVRGGSDVLPRIQGEEREDLSARQGEVRVSPNARLGTDEGRGEADERADTPLGERVAEVYGGELSAGDTAAQSAAAVGVNTEEDRPRSVSVGGHPAGAVSEDKPASEGRISENSTMGERIENAHGTADNGGLGTRQEDSVNNSQAAEDISPAASLSEDDYPFPYDEPQKSELLTALENRRVVFIKDVQSSGYPVTDARAYTFTDRSVSFDEESGSFVLRGNARRGSEYVEGAYIFGAKTAEEMEKYLVENAYAISGFGEEKAEVYDKLSTDKQFITDKVKEYLRDGADSNENYTAFIAEMDKDSTLADVVYNKAFDYAYEYKVPITEIPGEDLDDIIFEVVDSKESAFEKERAEKAEAYSAAAEKAPAEDVQMRLMPKELNKKQREQLEKLTAGLEREYKTWDKISLDGNSDPFYEDGVSLDLTRNHIIYFKRTLAEQFPDHLPEIYNRELPPEMPRNYQTVKAGDILRFEVGDYLVLKNEKRGYNEYFVDLQDENGEVITQNLRDIKGTFENLTNRSKLPSKVISAVRVGDFYELYGENARKAAAALDLVLTKKNGEDMAGFPAFTLDNNRQQLENAGFMLNIRGEEHSKNAALDKAKALIADFISREYENGADVDMSSMDMSNIPIAYTEDERTGIPVQVYADLENYKITKLYLNKIVEQTNYKSVEDMLGDLGSLDFNELVSLTDEQRGFPTIDFGKDVFTERELMNIINRYDYIKTTKEVVAGYFIENDNPAARADYLKSIYNDEYFELIIGDDRYGYMATSDGLIINKGSYLSDNEDKELVGWNRVQELVEKSIVQREFLGEQSIIGLDEFIEKASSRETKPADEVYITVKPFSKVDFDKLGLDESKRYTISEFNAAYANAEKIFVDDEENADKISTVTITLHVNGKEYPYQPMFGAEYGTMSAIMDDISLTNFGNRSISRFEKELVSEIERGAAEKNVIPRENSITLTIPFSEHPAFYGREGEYSFALGNKLLGVLDEKQHREREIPDNHVGYYHKTDFLIKAVINGDEFNYEGRFDIGDGEGDLVAHLKNAYEYYLSDKGKQLLSYDGNYEQNRAEWERNRDILYPFLEKQTALSIEDNKRVEEFMQTEQEWFKMPDTEQKINAPAQDNVPLNIDRKTYLLNEMVKLTERFVGGKFGVAEFYNSHSKINLSDFADYLAEGYKAAFGKYNGYGDIHPWSLSEKGIDTTEILRKTGETVPLHIGWFVIARNIGECIDEGKFFTQQELDEHAKALNQSEIKPAAESIDWSRFTEKEYDEVKTAIKDKIILDGNDTYTLPLNSDKDLALSIEIQIVPMGEKWAVDYALWSDVMHDYINVGGYYDEDLPNSLDEFKATVESDVAAEIPEIRETLRDIEAEREELDSIKNFKEKTEQLFKPIEGNTPRDIEAEIRDFVKETLSENEIEAEVVGVAVAGSRSRGKEGENSDLDVVVEVKSDTKEYALFNVLNEQEYEIGGVKVDINPIRAEETGTLGTYLKTADEYLSKKPSEPQHVNEPQHIPQVGDVYRVEGVIIPEYHRIDSIENNRITKTIFADDMCVNTMGGGTDTLENLTKNGTFFGRYEEPFKQTTLFDMDDSAAPAQENVESASKELSQSDEDDFLNDIDTAELRDYFTNPARAEERERNAAGMLAQAEAVLNEEKSEENSEVKLKSVVIDIANGAVYEQDYPSPERATGGTNSQSENYPAAEKHDFTITDEHLGEGGAKTKFAANVAAIKTLKAIEAENRLATPDEQETLSKYVGWGGIPQAFDSSNKDWQKEYAELRGLLTDSEYEKARGSTLNAHYTTPTVISAIYKALDGFGFKGGNILEPAMGVGNFFGAMPEDLRSNSSLSGVELDDITGRIARQLYQNANIQIKGYEETELPDNFYDVAVGNVPFGSYQVADTKFNRENFLIHDYFFAKTLDKVAPNGIIAFVTSKGTMDKADAKAREYIARRADLIGAIRLPGGRNGAFAANANTEVTTDIIFLQKREQLAVELPDWCYVGKNADGLPVNQYFLDNPEMMLGKMESYKNMYGNDSETACIAPEGQNLAAELDKAVARLQKNLAVVRRDEQRNEERGIVPATVNVRNFTYTEINGKIFFRENNIMREHLDKVKGEFKPLKGKKLERMRGMIEIRELFRKLIDAQTENCSDERLAALQNELNSVYDKFVKRNGHISDSANAAVFRDDDDYNLICGLEDVNAETKEITKSDIFTKRTIKPVTEITHVETPQEAMQVSMDVRGKVDIDYMSLLCDTDYDNVVAALTNDNLIYKNPETNEYEDAAEYLSGNVRVKLQKAEQAAADNPEFARNVTALQAAIPPNLGAGDISVRIGVPWVTKRDYMRFLEEYAQAYFREPLFKSITGEYNIPSKSSDKSVAATQTFGTSRMNSYAIFERLLNNRDITVYDRKELPDGREYRVINKKETQLAQEKARLMKEAFPKWLWQDPDRREKYVKIYNELFNSIVGREYDGSNQSFPGMSPFITLNEHQKNAVMRSKLGGNTLLAHCVGAGKSFEMAAATMEKKRLGLIHKACVVVPKHLVGQMANEWLRLYPEAKLLTATEKDFDKDHRQRFIARCCTGDYDAVIMSYQQFEKIKMSFEYKKQFLFSQVEKIASALNAYEDRRMNAEDKRSVKDLEKVKKSLDTKIKKLLDAKEKDTSLNFEQLGFDCLVVDEAHNYKNGLVVTKMNNVSGVTTRPAQKSEDILMKTQYLNQTYGEKNIIFATGTPVSNSMTELYIMQQYLRPSLLKAAGLQNFDDWASTFGEVVTQLELKPAGDGFRMKKRFSKFVNLPELMQMYKSFADIRTADMLKLPVPEIEGGKPQIIAAKPDEFQKAYMTVLAERSELIHNQLVDPKDDNMLKVTNEARLLGLDSRCLNINAENSPNSKVNLLINKVMEIYEDTTDTKGVQAIFCDIAVHGETKEALDEKQIEAEGSEVKSDDPEAEETDDETEELDEERELEADEQSEMLYDVKFSVYKFIKEELVRRGVPENEICFAGDAKNQSARLEMYAQLRSGNKRIVLASTTKMGTGANIQTKLCALHNLDICWKPSDFEQRIGRIVRQGNDNPSVKIFNYVTEGTFDAYMLNLIVTKQKFISQLMSGKSPARTCEDVDNAVLNYSEMQAIASGNPLIKEKIELDMEVSRLRLLESEHQNQKYRLEDLLVTSNAKLSTEKKALELGKDDKAYADAHTIPEGKFEIKIGKTVYDERKAAGEQLRKEILGVMSRRESKEIGEYRGFRMILSINPMGGTPCMDMRKQGKGLTYQAELELMNDLGNVTRIENAIKLGIDKRISMVERSIERLENDIAEVERTKDAPFEYADDLATKSARLAVVDSELDLGKQDEVVMSEDETEDETLDNNREQDPPENKKTPPKHTR